MTNTDEIVRYILKNAGKLSADKIEALSKVIGSLGDEVEPEDNNVEPNDDDLTEDKPIDFTEVTGVKVDNSPERKVKVYKRG